MARRIGKIILWILLVPVILAILVPALLYIPPIQNWAVGFATEKASSSTGMDIHVGRLRLTFPLRLNAEDVAVFQTPSDTMITARHASVAVKLLPLLKGDVAVENLSIDSAFYQMGNADSAMWLRAYINHGDISTTSIGLKDNVINLDRANISGVRVWMRMLEDSTDTPADTTASTPWVINAGMINISDVDYTMQMLPLIDSLGCHIDDAALRQDRKSVV